MRRRLALVIAAGIAVAVAGSAAAVAVNVATGGSAPWFPGMDMYPLWWAAGSTALVAAAGLLAWQAQRRYDQALAELIPAAQQPEPWWIRRPDEVGNVITALRRKGGKTVVITTALQGAGGFGKTTIAKMTRRDPRVLRRYRGRVHWVTVGRDAGKPALAGLVNGLIAQLEPGRVVTFTDVGQAADHLAAILARGPRRLLVVDDVWTRGQLDAFPVAGKCARLVTTRVPSLTGGTAIPVTVDKMSTAQARALLLQGLPPLPPTVTVGLLKETGRWPLLLHLANKILTSQAALGADVTAAAEQLLGRLRDGGALAADELTGAAARKLDLSDPDQRATAVRATIEASTSLLTPADAARLAKLAVFAEDEIIPLQLITSLWRATGGMDRLEAQQLVSRLANLALLTPSPRDAGVTMHDVIRDYLREQLGTSRLAQLNATLLDATADGLPRAPAASGAGTVTAWWETPEDYLRNHLIEHLLAAGRPQGAEETAADLRWAAARLCQAGPAAPYADLALIRSSRAQRLQRLIAQNAHLLAPAEPPSSLTAVLCSRVSHDPEWGVQARALSPAGGTPSLSNAWPLPDLPDTSLHRVLAGHAGEITAMAVAPDGTWLVSASFDRTVRVWDTATGLQRDVFTMPVCLRRQVLDPEVRQRATALAVAPDGNWFAAGGWDATVRLWDRAMRWERELPAGIFSPVLAVAIAPDGTWLAAGSQNGKVRLWDASTGRRLTTFDTRAGEVSSLAIAPDGTWLAAGGRDGTIRVWDIAAGRQRAVLTGHDRMVTAVAVSPDGTWLATAGRDGTVRTWDTATWQQASAVSSESVPERIAASPEGTWLAVMHRHESVCIRDTASWQPRVAFRGPLGSCGPVAIAPDGTWLAAPDGTSVLVWDVKALMNGTTGVPLPQEAFGVAVSPDGSWIATAGRSEVRIWDARTGQHRATLTGHEYLTRSLAVSPDGTWLAGPGADCTVRIWDTAAWQPRIILSGHDRAVTAVAVSPDGTWLASAADDWTVRIWDAASGRQLRAIPLRSWHSYLGAIAIAPDGRWIAAGGADGKVRIWDARTGRRRATLAGHAGWVSAIAIAPDGTWLAAAEKDEGTVQVWDTATGRQRAVLAGHASHLEAVAASPDGNWLATADKQGLIRIWGTATWTVSAQMRVSHALYTCTWSPCGRSLAVAGHAGLYLFAFNP